LIGKFFHAILILGASMFVIAIILANIEEFLAIVMLLGLFVSIWWFCQRFTTMLWEEFEEKYDFEPPLESDIHKILLWPVRLILLLFVSVIIMTIKFPPVRIIIETVQEYLKEKPERVKNKRKLKGWDI